MYKKIFFLFILFTLNFCISIFAHPGSLDANGGHWNRKTGVYHYHDGTHTTNLSNQENIAEPSQQSDIIFIAGDFEYDENYDRYRNGEYNETNISQENNFTQPEKHKILFYTIFIIFLLLLSFIIVYKKFKHKQYTKNDFEYILFNKSSYAEKPLSLDDAMLINNEINYSRCIYFISLFLNIFLAFIIIRKINFNVINPNNTIKYVADVTLKHIIVLIAVVFVTTIGAFYMHMLQPKKQTVKKVFIGSCYILVALFIGLSIGTYNYNIHIRDLTTDEKEEYIERIQNGENAQEVYDNIYIRKLLDVLENKRTIEYYQKAEKYINEFDEETGYELNSIYWEYKKTHPNALPISVPQASQTFNFLNDTHELIPSEYAELQNKFNTVYYDCIIDIVNDTNLSNAEKYDRILEIRGYVCNSISKEFALNNLGYVWVDGLNDYNKSMYETIGFPIVYTNEITKDYHTKECDKLNENYLCITLKDANIYGLESCILCH